MKRKRYTVLACVVVVSVSLFIAGQGKLALCISLLFCFFVEYRSIESIEETNTTIQKMEYEEKDLKNSKSFEHPQYKEEIRAFEEEGISFFTTTRKERKT